MIKIEAYKMLSEERKELLEELIDEQFGDIPFVNQTQWAAPDWSIIKEKEGELVSFYNIVERIVNFDHEEVKVAGISNVITPNEHRKNGYASKMLAESEAFIFDELKVNHGLLLCADPMIPFYESLGWYLVESDVYITQPDGVKRLESNVLIRSNTTRVCPQKINLNGLPW